MSIIRNSRLNPGLDNRTNSNTMKNTERPHGKERDAVPRENPCRARKKEYIWNPICIITRYRPAFPAQATSWT